VKHFKLLAVFTLITLLAAGCFRDGSEDNITPEQALENQQKNPTEQPNTQLPSTKKVAPPISRYKERVTKKPFGIYITKATSPVQPEKFTGYHSGTDFETFPEEKDVDVPINAICNGKIAAKRTATGYGGLVTQYCTIEGQAVTVIYGHMRLNSVTKKVGDELKAEDVIGVLGTGYSTETDNERKHLHLGIVKGQGSDIRGYVQQESLLSGFLNVMDYL
jgi:murein DD-endopeptidase MepM/ murein hydrolase activator NlpD